MNIKKLLGHDRTVSVVPCFLKSPRRAIVHGTVNKFRLVPCV